MRYTRRSTRSSALERESGPSSHIFGHRAQKRHDLSVQCERLQFSTTEISMFWIAVLVVFSSALLVKLGALSVTASILSIALKASVAAILFFLAFGAWMWLRRR